MSKWLPMILMGAMGCVHARPVVSFGVDGEAATAEDVLQRVERAEATVFAVKGEAKLRVDSQQGSGSVSLFLAVLHPSSIHLEQLDFFGRPQGVLTTDGQRFGLYDAQAGRFLQGPASAQNLGRFLPLVLPPVELAALLLGRVPRIPHDSAELGFDADTGTYVVTLKKGAVKQVLNVSPPSHRVVRSRVQGIRAYDVEFSDIEAIGSTWYPKHAWLSSGPTKLELTVKDIALNEAPDLTLFELSPPENVPVVDVDALGQARGAQ